MNNLFGLNYQPTCVVIVLPSLLLQSKLAVPDPSPLFVPRPEVAAKLNAGLKGSLTTMVAGPGYGKTMHLAWFVRQAALPVAWLKVDEWDGDAARLLMHVRQAIYAFSGDADVQARDLTPESVAAELAAAAQERGALVFAVDDLHAAPGPFAAQFVMQLVRAAPPELHIFVTARPSLTLPVGKLHSCGQISEIVQADLRLNDPEAAAVLVRAAGHPLPSAQVERATALAAGWGAGLTMLGAALGRNSEWDLPEVGIPRELERYLLEETWSALPPGEQDLLTSTCLLGCMTMDLAVALVGPGNWKDVMERLHQGYGILSNLKTGEYSLHPLWDKFLRDRMTGLAGAAGMGARYRVAASAMAAQGRPYDAVRLYLRAHDYSAAAEVVAELAPIWTRTANSADLAEAMHDLPRQVQAEQPWLALWAAQIANAHGRMEEARATAEQAAQGFARDEDRPGQVAAAVLRCTLALTVGETELARRHLDEGFAALGPGMDLAHASLLEQRWLLMRTEASRDLDAQERLLQEVLQLYRQAPSPQPECEARMLNWLGLVALERGQLELAIERLEHSVELFRRTGSPPWESGFNLGAALSSACRFEDALAIFVPMSQHGDRPMRRLIASVNLLDIYITLDDPARAEAAGRGALDLATRLQTPHMASRVRAELARLYRQQGEYDLAVEEAHTAVAQAARAAERHFEFGAGLALAEATLWVRSGCFDVPERRSPEAQTFEDVRAGAMSGLSLLRGRSVTAREEGAALLRQALRELTQKSYFRSFVLRHWDLALTVAVAGLAAGVLPFSCRDILRSLESLPPSVLRRGISLPEPEARALPAAMAALDESEAALLERLLPPHQRAQSRQSGGPALRVRLLGHLSVRLNGAPVDEKELGWRRGRSLLLTLLLIPKGVERDVLCDWLWPDANRSSGHNLLRVSLHHLRRLLEPDRQPEAPSAFVRSVAGKLSWIQGATRVDLWDAEDQLSAAARAVREGNLPRAAEAYQQATALYRGPLVTDDCTWLAGMQEHLHQQMKHALQWLATYHRQERPEQAITCLQRLLELEPEAEEAVRELMRLLATVGRRAEVVHVYRRLCAYLETEFGVAPDPQTVAVYQEAAGVADLTIRRR